MVAQSSVERGEETADEFEKRLRRAGGWAGAIALLAAAIFAGALPLGWGTRIGIFGMAAVIGGAAGAIGGLLGFLFGIPKTLQSDVPAADGSTKYVGNTNLEQMSDWLTKILVGISLVQIGRAMPALADLGDSLRPTLGDQDSSGGFGLALCLYLAVVAFIVLYLWTRINLRRQMGLADDSVAHAVRVAVQDTVEPAVQKKVDEAVLAPAFQQQIEAAVDEQSRKDADVLAMIDRQLTGHNPPSQDELTKALASGSQLVLTQAYQRTEWQRKATWSSTNPEEQAALERTVPIFRALIAADPNAQYHRSLASLGYALKDIRAPQYGEAKDSFTRAIAIRDQHSIRGFKLYEWNRAVCSILLDTDYQNGRPSTAEQQATILADLRAASNLRDYMFEPSDPANPDRGRASLAGWLALNNLSLVDIHQPPAAASAP